MKFAMIALCLTLAACVYPQEFGKIDPREQSRTNGDIIVEVPHNRDDRVERQSASERCAQYGRTARRKSNGEYECIDPSRTEPDDWRSGAPGH